MQSFNEYANTCPECADNNLKRIKRRWWMRYLKYSKLFFCPACNKKILIWHDRVFMTFDVERNAKFEQSGHDISQP
ncbi:hypothetical protein JXQ70_16795 [bacterium]|nr:hypothetical protein [bacterium]